MLYHQQNDAQAYHQKTHYELWKGRKPNISHLRPFGCTSFIHNNGKDNLGKFDAKSDEGILVGYSLNGKAYRVFNKRTLVVEESTHVNFDKNIPNTHPDNDSEGEPSDILTTTEVRNENLQEQISEP